MSDDRLLTGAGVVVREYQRDAPAGLIGDWLEAREIPWRVSRPESEPVVEEAAVIIALGSSMSAYWSQPAWIADECNGLAANVMAGIPVLGICFGAQALARALGGEVAPAAVPEVGWVYPVSEHRPLQGPYLGWHFDAITLPPGATPLATTREALQAYVRGSAMGLQFHPEVTSAMWQDWSEHDPDALDRHVADPAALATEIADTAEASRTRTFALLDWWRAWLATLS